MLVIFEDLTELSNGFSLNNDQLPATLGRAGDVTVRLTNVLVSRQHCEIDIRDGELIVRDLGAFNGTQVNDQSIDECVFHSGDKLQVGLQQFLVECIDQISLRSASFSHAEDSHAEALI